MIACHVVAALMCMRLQVAADDWYEVAEVVGQLDNGSVTRVQGDEIVKWRRWDLTWPIDWPRMKQYCWQIARTLRNV
ncbi:hypothetical protein Tco_1389166 [Tanacetum coccineum]